jgi:nucleotide-binding universal stress UspA family protein
LEEKIQNQMITKIKELDWLKNQEVELVHIFKEDHYPYMYPPMMFPTPDQQGDIAKTVDEILQDIGTKMGFTNSKVKCLFSSNPKDNMVDYIESAGASMVITYSKPKEGFSRYFHSSFSDYLVKHAPCTTLILK